MYFTIMHVLTDQIVTLPYPLLLQRSAREALGLSLKNHVVIIDEAHNLMDAIAGIYSVSVTLDQVPHAAYCISPKVPQQAQGQESCLCRADHPYTRLHPHVPQNY
jgi:Rad3-related DNA helicase